MRLNNDGTYVGSGGFGWTHELPQPDFAGKVRPIDMWGFGESQETVGVSPGMFAEFIFPYQLPILERFGLNCYGCCEPLDKRWHLVEQHPSSAPRVGLSLGESAPGWPRRLGDRYIFSMEAAPVRPGLANLRRGGHLRSSCARPSGTRAAAGWKRS